MYLLDPPAQGNINAVQTFFAALAGLLPSGLTIQVPNSGDVISELTGKITGSWSVASTPAIVTGTGVGNYAGNAGGIVHWLTSAVVAGRRVRGRTFLVPLISSAFSSDGSLGGTPFTTISNAAASYVSAQAGVAVVWARPAPGRSGSLASITGSRVPDLAISLRSRRT